MKKKAEDLKPGDVFYFGEVARVTIRIEPFNERFRIFSAVCNSDMTPKWLMFSRHETVEVEVESPTLSPAQQHAEEAVKLVRNLAGVLKYRHTMTDAAFEEHRSASVDQVHEFLARIDPAKPPSVEELANALAECESHSRVCGAFNNAGKVIGDNARSILERARAAGMLKGGA